MKTRLTPCLVLVLIGPWPCGAAKPRREVTLSPRLWPKKDLQVYSDMGIDFHRDPGLVRTKGGLIAGTSCPFAVHAGIETLKQGGGAVDAAIVTSLAQIVRSGGSWNSFAGILYLVYFDARARTVHTLNAGFNTVLGETDPDSIPHWPRPSGRTALVPGFMAGIQAAHDRFGRLPFPKLFEPALYLADEGFVLGPTLSGIISEVHGTFAPQAGARAVFARGDGQWYRQGDRFRQPALAKTLRRVASDGAAFMYTGPWAEKLVRTVRQAGGKMTLRDLRLYRPTWGKPLATGYGDFVVHTLPPPELGGVQLIEAINVMEVAKVPEWEHYTKSDESLYWLMQICRLGHLMTFTPGLYQPTPHLPLRRGQLSPQQRLSKKAGAKNWRIIQKRGWESRFHDSLTRHVAHSDVNVVIDNQGNMAVLLHSINTVKWGKTGMFIDGVSIPDSAAFQQDMIRRVGPGARLPNITNPAIVTYDGRPFLGAGTIGASLHEMMLQSFVDILDFGMDPSRSLNTPKFWGTVWRRNPVGDPARHPQVVDSGTFPQKLLDSVRRRGQAIRELKRVERSLRISYWAGIQIDPRTGVRRGAASPISLSWTEAGDSPSGHRR